MKWGFSLGFARTIKILKKKNRLTRFARRRFLITCMFLHFSKIHLINFKNFLSSLLKIMILPTFWTFHSLVTDLMIVFVTLFSIQTESLSFMLKDILFGDWWDIYWRISRKASPTQLYLQNNFAIWWSKLTFRSLCWYTWVTNQQYIIVTLTFGFKRLN